MSNLLAIDVAILPPPEVSDRAKALNERLPPTGFKGLRLDEMHLPHITLTQQFVAADQLDAVLATVAAVVCGVPPFDLRVTGAARGNSVSMAVARSPALVALHERLMEALAPFERTGGADAFVGGDARAEDVAWVSGYREKSSFAAFQPHITIGHTEHAPIIEPFEFTAMTVAACQLGRFCTCMTVLEEWSLV